MSVFEGHDYVTIDPQFDFSPTDDNTYSIRFQVEMDKIIKQVYELEDEAFLTVVKDRLLGLGYLLVKVDDD